MVERGRRSAAGTGYYLRPRRRPGVVRYCCQPCAAPPLQDVIRFNEAIDQALAESIGHFSAQVDQARNLLL